MEELEIVVKEVKRLDEGKYEGSITAIEKRELEYEGKQIAYLDIYIKEKKTGIVMKYGVPYNLSLDSKLGRLIRQFRPIKAGEKVNLNETLVGKAVTFLVVHEETDRGVFARIADGSVKPIQ